METKNKTRDISELPQIIKEWEQKTDELCKGWDEQAQQTLAGLERQHPNINIE